MASWIPGNQIGRTRKLESHSRPLGHLRKLKTFSSDVLAALLLLTMQGAAVAAAALVLFLAHVRVCQTCSVVKEFLICRSIPSEAAEFDPTFQFVIMILQNVGRINSSVFDRNGFGSITTLQLNGLAGNQIEVVDATALHGLTNLKQLRLNNNRIRTIHPDSFTSLVSLTELDLSDNRLTRLSPRLLGSLRSVRSIRLHGNRWSCWCDAEDFVASLKGTVISSLVHSKPAFTPFTVLKASRATDSASSSSPLVPDIHIFVTLVSIIVLLSLLLGGMCLLLVMHRQKRSSKTVTPGCPGEREQEVSGSIVHLPSKSSELRGPEEASRRGFRGDRAKSAHAVILTAPFGVSGRDEVTFQAETEQSCGVSEDPRDTEVGQSHLTGLTVMEALKEHERGGARERRDQEENPRSGISVSIDVVSYLSIGRGQNKPGPDEESTEGPGQSPQSRKVMSRISTWPPAAAQWQARWREEEEEEEEDVWTGGAAEEIVNQTKPSAGSDHHSEEEENNPPQSSTHQGEGEVQDEEEELQEEGEELSEKAAGGGGDGIIQRRRQTSPEEHSHKTGKSSRAAAASSKQSAGSEAAGSKAPSGGATPDDETLLSGNEYVFVNLLHEVAHNNGRRTRERWKQTHLNKQRLEGAETPAQSHANASISHNAAYLHSGVPIV
ncbi:hypothetical protein OJAV_G00237220 [Oryzias javanicus]|uniref:LRRCT domain-containing protein n=1 Tax=Oryzias javanicus TaxID=123683 RepID=A0A3S2MBC3_ORYJA|nr:hypothetical protein OJAV_G00237220 [Oryzias javanicus]